jgi:outer membrane protein OmpA-like peptidoglycan-associated protein
VAQDTQEPAAQPTQEQQVQQQQQPETSSATGREPLTYERKEGFWGRINPFARKKYVQRQLEPVRGRVNELDELTAKNSQMIRDVDSRAQEGIRVADSKATQADQRAVEANTRATEAHQTATVASNRLRTVEQVVVNLDQFKPETEAEIRFRPGQGTLSARAKEALDEIATSAKGQKGYIIEVQGFSSGSGRQALENSERMADAVVRYFVLNHEIPVHRMFVLGMGNAPVQAKADGSRPKRIRGGRVEIRLLKNSVADMQTIAMTQPALSPAQSQGRVQDAPSQPAQQQQAPPTTNEQR